MLRGNLFAPSRNGEQNGMRERMCQTNLHANMAPQFQSTLKEKADALK